MITYTKLGNSGRLGNQLWQVASTLGLARLFNEDVQFPHWPYTPFFNVDRSKFVDHPFGTESDNEKFVPHLHEATRPYLQDFGLWSDIEDEVREWFTPSDLAVAQLQRVHQGVLDLPHPVLSVHVRRGDNVTEGEWKKAYHPPCDMLYYDEAIAMTEFASIAVFSDDTPWCQQQFSKYAKTVPLVVYEGTARPKEHEPAYATAPILDWIDLQLMTYCDHHVMSNSSYSWWGAYLSGDESPIYPYPFFGRKLNYVNQDLMFPPNWIRKNRRVT